MGVFDKEEYIDRLIKAYITYPISQADVPKEKRSDKCIVFREDVEILINKYKEQEQFIDWLVGYILDVDEIGYAECSGCKNDKYVGMYRSENKKCVECRIECFKKQFQKESKG